jgi:hypothetical protein
MAATMPAQNDLLRVTLLHITGTRGAAHQHALHLWAQQVPLPLQHVMAVAAKTSIRCDACSAYILCGRNVYCLKHTIAC